MHKRTNKTSNKKHKRTYRKKQNGGDANIPNYAQNTFQTDPNYMQVASRNVLQYGSGIKRSKRKQVTSKKMKGGNPFDFVANQLYNPITAFIGPASTQWLTGTSSVNSAAYIQPIGIRQYTSP